MSVLIKKIKRIINSRAYIFKGIYNSIIKKIYIEKVSIERMKICRSNICGYYDKKGESEMAIGNMGKETCSICGCILKVKTRVLECNCALEELSEEPLWKSVKL